MTAGHRSVSPGARRVPVAPAQRCREMAGAGSGRWRLGRVPDPARPAMIRPRDPRTIMPPPGLLSPPRRCADSPSRETEGGPPNSMRVKVFDFFSGCGGASQGFREAGMDIVFALDRDRDAMRTHRHNFPEAHFEFADIARVTVESVRRRVRAERPNPVLFCACAPCQPFTKQNTTRPVPGKDQRVSLLARFGDFVKGCRPDVVFVENVPGIQRIGRSMGPFGSFLDLLATAGYEHDPKRVALKRYGVPQSRTRLVLLASRRGSLSLPSWTHGPGTAHPAYETVRKWIEDLPRIEAGEKHDTFPNHQAAALSALNLRRIRATGEGGGRDGWPPELVLPCHRDRDGYTDVYGRMYWDRPATALTTRCISYSNGRFGHPKQDRAISVREAACLQTFPRDFRFKGGLVSTARQVGNAVPVRFAKAVGRQVIRHLAEVNASVPE